MAAGAQPIGAVYAAGVFVLVNLLLAHVAHLASCRLLPAAGLSVRLTASCLVFVAGIVILAQALSPFGLYQREAVALLVAALSCAAEWRWGGAEYRRRDAAALAHAARGAAQSRGAVLLILAGVAFGVAAWRGVTRTPGGWDSLAYHLPFAGLYVQTGRLGALTGPLAMDHYAHFPKNGEIVAAWLMLPFHGDLVVGLMNVGLLVWGWLATYALARELELAPPDAALAATAVCTSPFLYSYATTQNVDTLVYGALVSALVFLLRYLRAGASVDALLTCAGVGIAIGTKYTALPVGGLVLAVLAAAAWRRGTRDVALRMFAALLVVGVLGGRQFVLNAWSTGNPIYPLTVALGRVDLLRGSPYTEWFAQNVGTGTRTDDLFQVLQLFHYYPSWATPMSAGPKYLFLIVLSLVALSWRRPAPMRDAGRPDARQDPGHGRWPAVLLVACAVLGILAAELPQSGFVALSRRFWPGSTSRLLGVSWGLFAVVGLTVLPRLSAWRRDLVRATLVAFTIWDVVLADRSFSGSAGAIASVAAVAVAIAVLRVPAAWRHSGKRVGAATAILMVVGLAALDLGRTGPRWPREDPQREVDGVPRQFADGWNDVDQAEPRVVAFATGIDRWGQNWFIYPLMGRRLQNTVTYVPLNDVDAPGSRAFVGRDNPNEAQWLGGLQRRGVDLVCVQSPWPIEDEWMTANARQFVRVHDDPSYRVYQRRR